MLLTFSTCFGRHTAHHQELKTVIAAFSFRYVFGFWTLRWLSHRSGNRQPKNIRKTKGSNYSFELLMMGGMSPETR
jgi:hypothetical protein